MANQYPKMLDVEFTLKSMRCILISLATVSQQIQDSQEQINYLLPSVIYESIIQLFIRKKNKKNLNNKSQWLPYMLNPDQIPVSTVYSCYLKSEPSETCSCFKTPPISQALYCCQHVACQTPPHFQTNPNTCSRTKMPMSKFISDSDQGQFLEITIAFLLQDVQMITLY